MEAHAEYVRRFREALPGVGKLSGYDRGSGWAAVWEKLVSQATAQAKHEGRTSAEAMGQAFDGFFRNEFAREKHFPPGLLLSQFSEHYEAGGGRSRSKRRGRRSDWTPPGSGDGFPDGDLSADPDTQGRLAI